MARRPPNRKTPRPPRERKPWHERMNNPTPEQLRREGDGLFLFVLVIWILAAGDEAVKWLMTHR